MPDLEDGLQGEEEVVWQASGIGVSRWGGLVARGEGEWRDCRCIVRVDEWEEFVGAGEEYGVFFYEDFVSLGGWC
jgi:hypothetical protein